MLKYILTAIIGLVGLAPSSSANELCPQLLDTGWRGIDCLYCLHPKAPENSAPITQLLKDTCLKNVMISFVIDGSFGWKQGEMERAVRELRQAGRNVWLHIYVYNGPAQRRWQSNVFNSVVRLSNSCDRPYKSSWAAYIKRCLRGRSSRNRFAMAIFLWQASCAQY